MSASQGCASLVCSRTISILPMYSVFSASLPVLYLIQHAVANKKKHMNKRIHNFPITINFKCKHSCRCRSFEPLAPCPHADSWWSLAGPREAYSFVISCVWKGFELQGALSHVQHMANCDDVKPYMFVFRLLRPGCLSNASRLVMRGRLCHSLSLKSVNILRPTYTF
jgi:hypothetical protein